MKKGEYFPLVFSILGFSFIIIIHEFGHFLAAKWCGLEVSVFSLGFGPALFKIFFYNTSFQISLIPLGGYVSFDPVAFSLISYVKQVVIVLAGIFANIVFAYMLILFCYKDKKAHSFFTFFYVLSHIQELSSKTFLKGNENKAFVGPFGIMYGISESYKEDLCTYFLSLSLLSLNLALFNVLPLPLLDGGKFVQITVDALFGPQPGLVIFLISLFLFFILMTIISNLTVEKAENNIYKLPD